jgi:hypothetical protein
MRALPLGLLPSFEQTLRSRVADVIEVWVAGWCAARAQPKTVIETLTQTEFDRKIELDVVDVPAAGAWSPHCRAKDKAAMMVYVRSSSTDFQSHLASVPSLMALVFGSTGFGAAHKLFARLADQAEKALINGIATALKIDPASDAEKSRRTGDTADTLNFNLKSSEWRDSRVANLRFRICLGSAEILLHLNAFAVEAIVPARSRQASHTKLASRLQALSTTKLELKANLSLSGLRMEELHQAQPGDVLLSSTAFGTGLSVRLNNRETNLQAQPNFVDAQRAISIL